MGRLDARKIEGFPGYLLTPEGEVISLERTAKAKGGGIRRVPSRILSPHKDTDGYLIVTLFIDGHRKYKRINRLLAEIFIPNPDKKPEVNHKNSIKTDNRLENLEWVTNSENMLHAWAARRKT